MSEKINGNDLYAFYDALRTRQRHLAGTTMEVEYRLLADKVETAIVEAKKWRDAHSKAVAEGRNNYQTK
jgi:hypothetical protein